MFWAGGERCIQTGKMIHLPAGRSRSLGQQPGKPGYRRVNKVKATECVSIASYSSTRTDAPHRHTMPNLSLAISFPGRTGGRECMGWELMGGRRALIDERRRRVKIMSNQWRNYNTAADNIIIIQSCIFVFIRHKVAIKIMINNRINWMIQI